jgi:hypothetical protein
MVREQSQVLTVMLPRQPIEWVEQLIMCLLCNCTVHPVCGVRCSGGLCPPLDCINLAERQWGADEVEPNSFPLTRLRSTNLLSSSERYYQSLLGRYLDRIAIFGLIR